MIELFKIIKSIFSRNRFICTQIKGIYDYIGLCVPHFDFIKLSEDSILGLKATDIGYTSKALSL